MNDLTILLLYVIVFTLNRSAGSLLALLVFAIVAYTAHLVSVKFTYDAVYWFAIASVIYAMLSVKLRRIGNAAWVGCAFVSLYSLWFSFDSWINWDVETWTYQNHESIVFTAHILVMLLLISVRSPVVSPRYNLFWRNRCSSKDNECN